MQGMSKETKSSEEIRINVRTTAETKRDSMITAKLRGLTLSSLVNLLLVRANREEKALEPEAFKQTTHSGKVAARSQRPVPLLDSRPKDGGRRHKAG